MAGQLVIGDVFRNAARSVPEGIAGALGAEVLTFGRLNGLANRTARALLELGVRRGDRVAVWSSTSLDVLPLFGALAKLGAAFVPLNDRWHVDEAAAVTGRSAIRLLVSDADHAEPARTLGERSGIVGTRLDGLATDRQPRTSRIGLAAMVPALPDDEPDGPGPREDDPHVVFFTSGSTGPPKGALLSHRANVLRAHPGALLEPRGAMVCPYPLSHMGAWTISLQQWMARAPVVFVGSADAVAITEAIVRHRATRLNAVPAVWQRVLDHHISDVRGAGAPQLSTIRFADTGTSATPPELLRAMGTAKPAAQIRVFYGSTEAGSVCSLGHADVDRKPGSCGVPGPLAEVRVDNDGELWVRGPLLFDGYLADRAATDAALVDGWYRTGDLAELDGEGYVTINGRVGEVIRTGGESVAPSEVEATLIEHPAIADVAVVGLPDARWGQIVCAVVVTAHDHEPPQLAELRDSCGRHLASFKHPRKLVVVDEVPRTPATGQVQRRLLVERLT